MAKSNKLIALTPGEPAGIGPDIVAQLLNQYPELPIVLIADPKLIQERAKRLGIKLPNDIPFEQVSLSTETQPGILNPDNANYVLNCLQVATQGCLEGNYHALVTGPVHKGIINRAGIPFSGHTEYLAQLTKTSDVVMLMACETFKVALLTTHLPLSQVPRMITQKKIYDTVQVIHQDLQKRFQINEPKIAVCGLNPHAGEGGYLGDEEIKIIIPAIHNLAAQGLHITGPLPADTAFTPTILQQSDVVLTMYHDQGLPVIKALHFKTTVNVTLGLPIIRTSVDHGTALELAGTGKACHLNLLAAIQLALKLKV